MGLVFGLGWVWYLVWGGFGIWFGVSLLVGKKLKGMDYGLVNSNNPRFIK